MAGSRSSTVFVWPPSVSTLPPKQFDDALLSFQEDLDEGRYVQADLLWRAALKRAGDLSRKHTSSLGCRSLDVLHVASALELDMKSFLTFDRRQRSLATAAGLKPIILGKK